MGRNDEAFIEAFAFGGLVHDTGDDGDGIFPGEVANELFGTGSSLLGDDGDVHAEAGRKHFGQDDEAAGVGTVGGEERADFFEILGFVFPDDIELAAINFHACGEESARHTIPR